MVEAIVLAGSKNDGRLQAVSEEPYEALIPVRGIPMVNYVLQALEASPSVEGVILVGPEPPGWQEYSKVRAVVPERWGGSPMDTLALGLAQVSEKAQVLVSTADIPLLSSQAVEDFLQRARQMEGELYYAVVSRQANDAYHRGIKRTYVRLRDGVFTGGNLFFFDASIVPRCWEFVTRMAAVRKKPWQMVRILGWRFILRFLARQLTVSALEERVQELLGVKVRAVITPCAEVGVDVDKVADHRLVEEILSARNDQQQPGPTAAGNLSRRNAPGEEDRGRNGAPCA